MALWRRQFLFQDMFKSSRIFLQDKFWNLLPYLILIITINNNNNNNNNNNIVNINNKLKQYKINWRQHIQRMDDNRLPKKIKLQTWRENKHRKTINEVGRWFPGGSNRSRGLRLIVHHDDADYTNYANIAPVLFTFHPGKYIWCFSFKQMKILKYKYQ